MDEFLDIGYKWSLCGMVQKNLLSDHLVFDLYNGLYVDIVQNIV